MIRDTLDKLISHIKADSGLNVTFGRYSYAAGEYPGVNVTPAGGGDSETFDDHGIYVTIPFTISVYNARSGLLQSYDIIETILRTINQFQSGDGKAHGVTSAIQYREETDTAILYFDFTLKAIIHNSQ